MASTCRFFDEDAVYRINKKKIVEVGLVLENSEFLSSDEELSDEAHYPDWQRMKKEHVRVAWHPNGSEEVVPERKVRLFDRSLMPGDVVRKLVKGKDTQLGYCRNTNVNATVQVTGTKQVLIGVDSRDLIPMEEFSSDIAVFRDSWVGMVKTVKSELTICCSDGSRCIISDLEALDMDDILDKRDRTSEYKKYSYYPGQQLFGPTYCFESAKWLTLNKDTEDALKKSSRSIRVSVEDVKIVSLGVQWVCRAYSEEANCNIDREQPKYLVQGEDLKAIKMMNIFEPCTLQIGDRNYLIIKDTYRIISLNEWKTEMSALLKADNITESPVHKRKVDLQDQSEDKENIDDTEYNVIEGNDSDFEDIDEDNDDGVSSDSASITSHSTASSVERTKGVKHRTKKGPSLATKMLKKKKFKRARRRIAKEILPLKVGEKVVTEALITETKANVVWQDGTIEQDIPSTHLYPVHHLDGHEFFPGDFVVDSKDSRPHEYGVVKQVDHSGRTAYVTWMKTYHAGADPHLCLVPSRTEGTGEICPIPHLEMALKYPDVLNEQEVSVYDIKDHPDFKYRPGSCVIRVANFEDSNPESTAGQVVDVLPTGQVEVSWVNGNMSRCFPQELYRVGEYDSDDLWGDDDSYCEEEDSWETESEASVVGPEEGKQWAPLCQWSKVRFLAPCGSGVGLPRSKPSKQDISLISQDGAEEKESEGNMKDMENINPKEEKEEEKSTEDNKSIQEKLLANIEKLRAGMARLEEVFTQNPTLQTCNVMRRLLELYKHCKVLDQLLGTTYFHEKHLQSLVERLRHRGRVNSLQHMADQISRLFSISVNGANTELSDTSTKDSREELNCLDTNKDDTACVHEAVEKIEFNVLIEGAGNDSLETCDNTNCISDSNLDVSLKNSNSLLPPIGTSLTCNSNEPRNICQQLCAILKSRLLKAHEDVEQRFGMSHSDTTALLADDNDISPEDGKNIISTPTKINDEAAALLISATDEDVYDGVNTAGQGVFSVAESVPDNHKYKLSILQPTDLRAFFKTIKKEMQILKTSLPDGIIVKGFDDRIDLYSVLIKGPRRTPYEDGLFFFDFQFPADYPKVPPLCHYISYCSDRLNPNLYEGGKVCVSLLGTWDGKGTEVWSSDTSNLLQVLVSIQGLILVSEPYFNEAGYDRQRGTQQGRENSRVYNEMVVLKLVQAMTKLVLCPPDLFKEEIVEHFRSQSSKLILRLERWLTISEKWNTIHPASPTSPTIYKELHSKPCDGCGQDIPLPEFALIPASKGFCLTLRKSLASFKEATALTDIVLR